jgi:signal transduction histidine kinase
MIKPAKQKNTPHKVRVCMTSQYYIPAIVLVAGIALVVSWMIWITPVLENNLEKFSQLDFYVGKSSIVDAVGDKMPEPTTIYSIYSQQASPVNSTTVKIDGSFNIYDAATEKKLWDSNSTNLVDKNTGKFLKPANTYFRFPQNTQKQDYLVYLYSGIDPQPFVFQGVTSIQGIEVYKFSCKMTSDLSESYPEFSPKTILSDYTCDSLIEPVTGNEVYYDESWTDYTVSDGKKVPVSIGNTHTAQYAQEIAIKETRDKMYLFDVYGKIIPTLLAAILASICIAVTVYQRQKQKITEARIKKEKDDNLTAIGLLSSRLAHDIRNPLAVIKNGISLLKYEVADQKSQERFDMIDKAVTTITHQINDIMDFVRSKPLVISENFITDIITRSIKSLLIPEGITINVEPSDIKIKCDSKQLAIVFTNLISNAMDAMNHNGTITIQVNEVGGFVHINVQDMGPGVPSDIMEKIFDPLFTTKQTGTGLGLVSCKSIVEQHGGKITVSNNPTTFTIILPKNL